MQILLTIATVVLIVVVVVDIYAMLCISEYLLPAAQRNCNTGMMMAKLCLLGAPQSSERARSRNESTKTHQKSNGR